MKLQLHGIDWVQFLLVCVGTAATWGIATRQVRAQSNVSAISQTSQELTLLFRESQADHSPKDGKSTDWAEVTLRDEARLARVKELYVTDQLQTGEDLDRAAMILQNSTAPEDYLLAHELCVVAISKGFDAKWLAAAAEDRFLTSIGRPQRFGTQYRSDGTGMHLLEVDSSVTDGLRRTLAVPSLADAKAYEAMLNGGKAKQDR